jgi:hypothetical protein
MLSGQDHPLSAVGPDRSLANLATMQREVHDEISLGIGRAAHFERAGK